MRVGFLHVLVLFLVTVEASLLLAEDANTPFEAANKLYEQGKYAEAVSAYEKLIAYGKVSAPLYFNTGNAYFKLGQMGRAIAAYRQAEQLSPRDPDVHANLQFARNQVSGSTAPRAAPWQRWLERLTVNEWTLLAAGAVWLLFLLLAFAQLRPELRRNLRRYALALGATAALLSFCVGAALRDHSNPTAIVIAREAVVRNGPLDESQSAFTAHDGAELSILDQKDEWLRVSDGTGRAGWLRRDAVLIFEPLSSRAGTRTATSASS